MQILVFNLNLQGLLPRVSVRKTFAKFLRKKAQIFAFVALLFARKNSTLRNYLQTLFRENFAIPLLRYSVLRYSVLRNFAEQILIKRLIKGVNCINSH